MESVDIRESEGDSNDAENRHRLAWADRLQRAGDSAVIGKPGHVGFKPPTEKMEAYLRKLVVNRGINKSIRENIIQQLDEGTMSFDKALGHIRYLQMRAQKHFREGTF